MWKPPKFRKPPPVPVYEPTEEEFKDPLAFISSIRAEGERYGIVKIRPPPSFNPTFALDMEDFRFRPRRQRISELSACTRVRQNFLDKLSRFWEFQGIALKIPRVENELLCLFTFHEKVQKLGGFVKCSEDRKWGELALSLGFASKSGSASALRGHYERILYPFDVLTQDLKPESTHPSRRSLPNKAKLIRQQRNTQGEMEESKPETKIIGGVENKELAKLKLFGAGPKMQGLGISPTLEITDNGRAMRKRESVGKTDSPRKHADVTLRCDKCGAQCAMTDVVPKLFEVPKDKWHCWSCMKTFIPSLLKSEKFGFEQSEREYSLREFAERADEFKREYFGLPPHNIDIDRVEEEFWRLTDDIEGELTVEYGADIQALEKGSGFCSRFNPPGSLEDKHYKDHPWNLVNLPVAKKSVLQYIDGDISGVKVPWLYVGMCFSAFAWHTEDHWTYSINYHHFGEPKIWYAASRFAAEDLERVYRAEAKDLYNHNRDLMHHITTTLSPAVLLENNVEVYRAVQNPGEFIITFPRGYHAGFNSGLNMNEAVNFCPPDWITIGRQALKNYRVVQRYNIFSQDELILKISQEAANNNSVEGSIVTLAHQDMKFMIEREVSERNQIMKLIKPKTAKTRLKNDTYCGICQTAVFCSYVVFDRRANLKLESDEIYEVAEGFVDQGIEKGRDNLLCLLCAISKLETCDVKPQHVNLMIHWEISELEELTARLKKSLADYEDWEQKIQNFHEDSGTLEDFKELLEAGKYYDTTRMYQNVRQTVEEAEKAKVLIEEVFNSNSRPILTHNDLSTLVDRIETFPFTLEKTGLLTEQLRRANSILDELKYDDLNFKICENLINRERSLLFEIVDMRLIREMQKVIRWLPKLSQNYKGLDEAQKVLEEAYNMPGFEINNAFMQRLKRFEADLEQARRYNTQAQEYLNSPDHTNFVTIDCFVENMRFEVLMRQFSPQYCVDLSRERKASYAWKEKLEKYLVPAPDCDEPSLQTANRLLKLSEMLQLHPIEVGDLHERVERAEEWIEKLKKIFIKKGCAWSLKEVLLPRTPENACLTVKDIKERKKRNKSTDDDIDPDDITDDMLIDRTARKGPCKLRAMEKAELEAIKSIRAENKKKLECENSKYCSCQRVAKSTMFTCDLCGDWYHALCHKRSNQKIELCIRCVRSRRPNLNQLYPLLQDLASIGLHFEESEYLQSLIERVISWQTNYKCLISNLSHNSERNLARATNLYLEGLLLEVSCEDQTFLYEAIKEKWPDMFIHEPPEGASLSDETKTPNRKRRDKDADLPRRSQNPRKKNKGVRAIEQIEPESDNEDDDDDVEDDGPCAAGQCKRPDGNKVEWVYCERCAKWYHMFCLNVNPKDVRDDPDFVCSNCQIIHAAS